jgi:hypothetical protein
MKHTFLRSEGAVSEGDLEQYIIVATNNFQIVIIKDRQI